MIRKSIYSIVASCVLVGATTGTADARTRESFNENWSFARTETSADNTVVKPWGNDALSPDNVAFNDSQWRKLNIPHDWAIEGPFDINLDGATGKLPWAQIGWYRKSFEIPATDKGKRIFLDMDGAMANSTIYLNGKKVGGRPYGYISFRTELTDAVKLGEQNTLAVRLNTKEWGSRWYPGAGIYRNVWIVKTDPVHIEQWGVHIQTPELTDKQGTATFDVTVDNKSEKSVSAHVQTTIYEYGTDAVVGKEVARSSTAEIQIEKGSDGVALVKAVVVNPKRWDILDPQRYLSRTQVSIDGSVVDTYDQPFGFRTLEFTTYDGFKLNGRRVQIQGVCMHHDLGPLGSAFNTRALERQIEIMKEMGVNAIRTSHNQPAPEVLEVCDRMGILVQVETFDCWREAKVKNDYSVSFDEWHERDLISIIKLARNNPSVFMWCLGNEVKEKNKQAGIEIMKMLNEITKRYDRSRPTTMGSNSTKPAFSGFQEHVDVFGFNYQLHGYEKFHKHKGNENQPFHGSETSSCISSRGEYFFPVFNEFQTKRSGGTPSLKKGKKNSDTVTGANYQMSSYDVGAPGWACTPDYQFMTMDKVPAAFGEFVWTGFDYIGEPTPYNKDITNLLNFSDPKKIAQMKKELEMIGKVKPPSRSSYFGIVDLCGFKKDRFYIYQAQWRPELPMAHILPHWNWAERIGKVTPIHVYTSGDEAELFLNGKSLGRRKKGQYEYRLHWDDVTYEPGTVKVVAYKNGKIWAEDIVMTTGEPNQISAIADRIGINADGQDLSFITIAINDKDGLNVPRSNNNISFSIDGPGEIIAIGNGDATSHESFLAMERKAYNGLCLAIVRSVKGKSGAITVTAKSEGLTQRKVVIQSK